MFDVLIRSKSKSSLKTSQEANGHLLTQSQINILVFINLFKEIQQVCFYRKPFADVASMEPAVFIQSLCSLLRVFQVPLEHVFTLDTHLETPQQEPEP